MVSEELVVLQNIVYREVKGRQLRLDIHRKKCGNPAPAPAVIYIYGGGWKGGKKDSEKTRNMCTKIASAGYLCAAIEHRSSVNAIFPASVEDCKCAVKFLRAHADVYRIDPDRIAVWGISSGGHLAAMLGTSWWCRDFEKEGEFREYFSRVQAVCDWCGPTDFVVRAMDNRKNGVDDRESLSASFIGGPILDNRETAELANPCKYIEKDTPPFIIVQGEEDNRVPIRQSELLYEALRKKNIEIEFHRIKGLGHSSVEYCNSKAVEISLKFMDKHLKK